MPRPSAASRWLRPLFALWAGTACILETERGPDVGECAVVPDGVYSWGDIGIGSCIAGPADLRFIEQDGTTWLAVTNADPYRSFRTGSVLMIDYEAIDRTVPRNYLHELPTFALEIDDDDDGDGVTETAMLGQMGVLSGGRLIVPGRHTEDGVAEPSFNTQLRAGHDELYVIDIDPVSELPNQRPEVLRLRDDPFPVVVGDDDLAYVGNLTDHSVSVLSVEGDDVVPIDVAEQAEIFDRRFTDEPGFLGTRSMAELQSTAILQASSMPDDLWTVTYSPGTLRTYVPTVQGVWRHDGPEPIDVGATSRTPSPTGPDYGSVVGGDAVDPFYFLLEGVPFALYADVVVGTGPTDTGVTDTGVTDTGAEPVEPAPTSTIRRVIGGTTASSWDVEALPLVEGVIGADDAIMAGPSLVALAPTLQALYYDGRAALDGNACIYRSLSEDGVTFQPGLPTVGTASCPDADLVTAFDEVAQPFVRFDAVAGRFRMWFSARQGARWVVAHALSDDGQSWRDVQVIIELPQGSAGGPTVNYEGDRYRMALSVDTGRGWQVAVAVGPDGVDWSSPDVSVPEPGDALPAIPSGLDGLDRPTRPGALYAQTSSWRIEGYDYGFIDARVVAGSGTVVILPGFSVGLVSGHEVSNKAVPSGWADAGLKPSSVADVDGVTTIFATTSGNEGRQHIVALQASSDPFDSDSTWSVVEPFDAIDGALAPAGTSAVEPVVVQDDEGYVMFYGLVRDGVTRIRRATSPDGLSWSTEAGDLVDSGDEGGWDTSQLPHSVELTERGVTLWYAGDDTSRFRIGAATAPNLRGNFTASPGEFDPWRFGLGIAGSFDDSGVKDPLLVEVNGERHLYYSGFDGESWHLGHALYDGDQFVRRVADTGAAEAGEEELSLSAHSGLVASFSARGVESPVLMGRVDTDLGERLELLYAGFDGQLLRLGRARSWANQADAIYPDQRRPTSADALSFRTTRGGDGVSVIELGQSVDAFVSDGIGLSALTYDAGKGMIYAVSKLSSGLFAIDVRDDSTGTFLDANAFDLEAVMRPAGGSAGMGFRGLQLVPDRGLLYATSTNPDGIWVFDLDTLVDNDSKDDLYEQPVAVLPLPSAAEDAGVRTQSGGGGFGMALAGANDELLLVTHFRDNSLFVYDLSRGFVGEEVAYLPFIGENPHLVRVAPDGLTAVVANYTGEVIDGLASSTLAIIDLDPDSDTYLEPLTWIANK